MATTEPAAAGGRKRPSKGVLIRLAIYVPLLSFFGWRAADRALDEREAADAAFRTDLGIWLETPPGIVDLSNAIPVQGDAFLSAPPGEETGTETGGTETDGTETDGTETGTTGTTGTTSETGTGDETGDTGTAGETGEATSTTTTTGPTQP
jgi:hypothetical protein